MEKLEIKHLAGYLPYDVQAINTFKNKVEILGLQKGNESVNNSLWSFKHTNGDYIQGYLYECKPILRPLSDLTKEIEVNGDRLVPINRLNAIYRPSSRDLLPYQNLGCDLELNILTGNYSQELDLYDGFLIVQKLLEWHFDIYGLIEKGLSIDINTLK